VTKAPDQPDATDSAQVVSVAARWHVNANPASFDYLIPTQLEFTGTNPLTIRYPAGKRFSAAFAREAISVYSGTVAIDADFADQQRPAQLRLRVQACSDEICLPPATLPVPLH